MKHFYLAACLLLAPALAHSEDWATPLMWNWVITTAHPKLNLHDAKIATLESQVGVQAAQIAALQAELANTNAFIQSLQTYVSVDDMTDPTRPAVIIAGANLQVVNGLGNTQTTNGTGNILVGYDENMQYVCLVVPADMEDRLTESACTAANGWWWPLTATKTGSHNVIVGDRHTYSSFSAIVSGTANTSLDKGASVIGGAYNTASGAYSGIIGGVLNNAIGRRSTVTGGATNSADGGALNGSISGGSGGSISGEADWRAGTLFEDN